MNISKELFEAVMDINNVIDINYDSDSVIAHYYRYDKNEMWKHSEFIDSFFFKCKEWAFKNKKILITGNSGKQSFCMINLNEDCLYEYHQLADSEQQAVFDACTWILENK